MQASPAAIFRIRNEGLTSLPVTRHLQEPKRKRKSVAKSYMGPPTIVIAQQPRFVRQQRLVRQRAIASAKFRAAISSSVDLGVYDNQVWRGATDAVALNRWQERPALRTCVPARCTPTAWAVEPIQRVQPGVKQGVAPPKRAHCLFAIVWPNLHGTRIARDG